MALPVRVTAPEVPPVTLDEIKRHLRIDHDDEDDLIGLYLDAAVGHLDGLSGTLTRCLVNQVWRQDFHRFRHRFDLAFPNVSDASVAYLDAAGNDIATTHVWALQQDEGEDAHVSLDVSAAAPSGLETIRVTYTAGYGAIVEGEANPVPGPIRSAILLMVGDLYRFRETAEAGGAPSVQMSLTVERLLSPYRRHFL
ncbi:head-tail connector protein [Jiella pelagia]|uniref:Head-tail connector protein n=1 Tax=Jiella pelagia TaxID=2986949 RepID=A0ABY7BUT9_9HYPH|nr:head-tail connector protein [Jiella pelagia]WAP67224.1 head-tail connector protein [Jiella pelagia]